MKIEVKQRRARYVVKVMSQTQTCEHLLSDRDPFESTILSGFFFFADLTSAPQHEYRGFLDKH